jgi:hypothetical protein
VFFTAVYFSYTLITENIQKSSLLERFSDDALDTYIILHLAESGDEVGTKESLNLKLDNYIYEIYQLSQESISSREDKKTSDLLHKIAKHRKLYPREAKNILQKDVDIILEGYAYE